MNKARCLAKQGLVLATAIWSATSLADVSLTVSNAWVRETPPNAEVSAAYLTVHNQTSQAHTLMGISSPQFQKAEMHRTQIVNGQARMQRMPEVIIDAHGSVEFKPEGYHLMLIKPLRPLKVGDTVELRLRFNDSPQVTIQAPIRKTEDAEDPHHNHDMNDMKM